MKGIIYSFNKPLLHYPKEYEVFLSFNDDEDGENFHDWWHERGYVDFCKWVNEKEKI